MLANQVSAILTENRFAPVFFRSTRYWLCGEGADDAEGVVLVQLVVPSFGLMDSLSVSARKTPNSTRSIQHEPSGLLVRVVKTNKEGR